MTLSNAPTTPPHWPILGDFELRKEIGRGGMGTVYEAFQKSLDRVVALKVLAQQISSSPAAVQRFRREANAAAKLNHPHIIPIFAQGEQHGVHYYAMEFVDGPSLNHVIAGLRAGAGMTTEESETAETVALDRSGSASTSGTGGSSVVLTPGMGSGPVTGSRAASAAVTHSHQMIDHFRMVAHHVANVADALAYAHERGVIHRDIKPHNLILGADGRIRVSDFGLARLAEQPGVTLTGEVIGSPLYMSPEQIVDGPGNIDHRTDVYSLGATLYEWLTLTPPYPGETRERIIRMLLTSEAPPPRSLNGAVPVDLETICEKALERDRARRYQSAADLRDDLRRFLSGRRIHARRAGIMIRARRFVGRHQLTSLAAAVAVMLGTLSVALFRSRQAVKTQAAELSEARVQTAQMAEETRQMAEETRRLRTVIEMAGDVLPPEIGRLLPLTEKAVPVFQGLVESGQRARAEGEPSMVPMNLTSTAYSANRIAQRAIRDLFDVARSDPDGKASDPGAELMTEMLRRAVELWPSDLKAALQIVEGVLAVRGDHLDARLLHAALSGSMSRYDSLASDAETLISLRPNDPIGYLWRGLSRMLLGDTARGLDDFTFAAGMPGLKEWSAACRGLALLRLGRPVDAIPEFDLALQSSPDLAVARMGRAGAYRLLGRLPEAVTDLSYVIEREPENVDAIADRGEVYGGMSNVDAFTRDFETALRLSGRNPELLVRYVGLLSQLRGPTEAPLPVPPGGGAGEAAAPSPSGRGSGEAAAPPNPPQPPAEPIDPQMPHSPSGAMRLAPEPGRTTTDVTLRWVCHVPGIGR